LRERNGTSESIRECESKGRSSLSDGLTDTAWALRTIRLYSVTAATLSYDPVIKVIGATMQGGGSATITRASLEQPTKVTTEAATNTTLEPHDLWISSTYPTCRVGSRGAHRWPLNRPTLRRTRWAPGRLSAFLSARDPMSKVKLRASVGHWAPDCYRIRRLPMMLLLFLAVGLNVACSSRAERAWLDELRRRQEGEVVFERVDEYRINAYAVSSALVPLDTARSLLQWFATGGPYQNAPEILYLNYYDRQGTKQYELYFNVATRRVETLYRRDTMQRR